MQDQPGEIGRLGRQFGGAPYCVDVFDADKKTPTMFHRHPCIEQRRIGMAEMQLAIGAGREAEGGKAHGPLFARLALKGQTGEMRTSRTTSISRRGGICCAPSRASPR
jgi:hypothetical protein